MGLASSAIALQMLMLADRNGYARCTQCLPYRTHGSLLPMTYDGCSMEIQLFRRLAGFMFDIVASDNSCL